MWPFLGLDSDLAHRATDWSLRWSTPWPLWAVMLLAGACVAYVYHLYHHEAARLVGRDRVLFTALRMAAVVVLLVMICEPFVVWDVPARRDASLLVLLDDSQSMGVVDRYEGSSRLADVVHLLWPDAARGSPPTRLDDLPRDRRDVMNVLTRADLVNRLLAKEQSNFLVPVSGMFDLRLYLFSEGLQPVGTVPARSEGAAAKVTPGELLKLKVVPEGTVTCAGGLLREAVASTRGRVAGVLLVTDGATNVGESLDSAARFLKDRRVPVYCVGVGDARPLRDVGIRNFAANRVVLLNDVVTADFELESQGFPGERVPVRLYRDGAPVDVIQEGRRTDAARFLLEDHKAVRDGEEVPLPQKCRLSFTADAAGEFTYELRVEPRPEELVTQNNVVSLPIRVARSKIRVLYLEGMPRWEYRYLKNALVRDETVEVSCFLTSADFDFPQEGDVPLLSFPDTEEELARFDVIIMGDVPKGIPHVTDDGQLELLRTFVEKLGGGFLMQAGPHFAPRQYRGTVIEKMLPVDLAGEGASVRGVTEEWKAVLTAEGEVHPMTRFEADVDANRRLWGQLPGFFWHYPVVRARPAARVLLTHPTERSPYGPHPLLVAQFYGSGKTAFLAVDSTWRWRGLVGDRYFVQFWGQVVRDLSEGKLVGTTKRFRVATDRSEYRAGEKVTVTARVLDRKFEPSRAPEVRARVEGGPGNVTTLILRPVAAEPGSFRGSMTPRRPGGYRVTLEPAEADVDEQAVSHQFLVVRSRLEFVNPRMRREELKRLADITGGRYFELHQLAEIPAVIERLKAAAIREVPDDMWNAPVFFTFFCGVFLTELLYRKMRKLI